MSSGGFLEVCRTCGGRARDCHCLHDIRDPSAFVHGTIIRARLVLSPEERAELHAEGIAILHKLAVDYRPQMEGHAQEGRFSGYAAMFLARKLGDAWHRMHPEHMLVTQPTGARRWEYGERAVSLDAILAEDPDRSELLADRPGSGDLASRLHAALSEQYRLKLAVIVAVGELLSEGASTADVAVMLGLSSEQVRDAVDEIASVIGKLQSEEQQ